MSSIAILIGNTNYAHQGTLECCQGDVEAVNALLEATERFEKIDAHIDLDADKMREVVRNAIPADGGCDKIFFYFSGHGDYQSTDFYYCGTGYDPKRPNLTGVSHTDLYDLFRAAAPITLVTVIDACFSGALLIKGGRLPPPPVAKDGFRNVLQFSSSLDSQTSMAGDRLSEFTRAFLEASVRKPEGAVFYTDIASALRDVFIENDEQTPFFVNQGTGREVLVEDAAKLTGFKSKLSDDFRIQRDTDATSVDQADDGGALIEIAPRSPTDLLQAAEAKMGSPEQANHLISEIFSGLVESFDESEFGDLFEKDVLHHSGYREPTIEDFMIRVLAREKRPDRLVTAEIKRARRKPSPFEAAYASVAFTMSQFNNDFVEHFNLELNCTLEKAQLKLTLTPKFRSLQRLVLVLSCAPSLEKLYVFEMLTRHLRTDWDTFDSDGDEVVRRWYTLEWESDTSWLIEKIRDALVDTVRTHVERSIEDLSDE